MKVLVIGAAPQSLGMMIARHATLLGHHTETAGLNGSEDHKLDVLEAGQVLKVMRDVAPTHVVCTVGVNEPRGLISPDLNRQMLDSFAVNVLGPLEVVRKAVMLHCAQVVVVSSNSAHIARRGSLPYCSSKAALSMAIRCAAREVAGDPTLIYGYEFGLLKGTPMTAKTEGLFGPSQTRIPGAAEGLDTLGAARVVVKGLEADWHGVNGTLLRYDGGEQ